MGFLKGTQWRKCMANNNKDNQMREIIKSRLQLISKEAVIKQMGYDSKKRGLESLDKFLTTDLYSWLHSGNYDFKYAPLEFFKTLCKIVDISDEDIERELQNCKIFDKELNKIKQCYIFINTNFKRTTESVWLLMGFQNRRRIDIDKDKLLFKTDEELNSQPLFEKEGA